MPEPAPVPSSYIGLWRRKGIWRSNGSADTSTLVLWFQSPSLHIDVRVGQIGFAGLTVVDGNRCTWHPEIAFPSVSSEVDTGLMRFEAANLLHEAATDGSFHEIWEKISDGPVAATRHLSQDGGIVNYLLTNSEWLAQAVGHPDGACEITFAQRHGSAWRVVASTIEGRVGEEFTPALS
jgi:hypothetical protein